MEGKIGKFITLRIEVKDGRGAGVDGWEVKETHSAIPYQAVIVSENAEACKIRGTSEKHTFDLTLDFIDDDKKVMRFLQANNTISQVTDGIKALMNIAKSEDKLNAASKIITPKVYDVNDNVVGDFDSIIEEVDGKKAYSFVFNYYDKKYKIYKTPTEDKKNFAYVIYDEGNIIAEVLNDKRKGLSLDQELLKYDIYALNNEAFKIACMFVTFWSRYGIKDAQKVNANFYDELSSKYSQSFIDNIKSNINPSYLIENMPLCEKLDKKARHYGPRLFFKCVIFLTILIIAIIFIGSLLGK